MFKPNLLTINRLNEHINFQKSKKKTVNCDSDIFMIIEFINKNIKNHD
jgi:hypothetical protein